MTPTRILITDADDDLRTALIEQLAHHPEFCPASARTGAEAVAAVGRDPPDLVILDADLPDMAPPEAVATMRRAGLSGPILLIGGPGANDADASGCGADDRFPKPFRFAALLARIRARLRPPKGGEGAALSIGPYRFEPGAKELVGPAGARLRLTEKETAILLFLHEACPEAVARDVLLREVWGYNALVTTHTLETHIYRLRQKIELDPAAAALLVTEPGGYKLVP